MPLGKQCWQVSPGRRRQNLWPEFSKSNIIAIGWDELGDLRKYSSIDDLEKELRRRWDKGSNSARSCWCFSRDIKKDNIVVAKHGASKEIYGIGKVTEEYDFKDERETFKHVIGVHWYVKFDDTIKVDVSKLFVQWTVHSLSEQKYLKIRDSILKDHPDLENNFRMMETGEGELDRGKKNGLNHAISRFKDDPRSKLWKREREAAYKKFRNKFNPENLHLLTKDDFAEFLLPKNNKAWTGLYRHKSQITSDMEKLRNVLAYLQKEEIDIEERIFEVLVKKESEFHIDGMGPNLATAILHVCDERDRYGVWNNRSIKTLKHFGLVPNTLPSDESKAYTIINKALNDLKKEYNIDLTDVDSFVYWADAFYGKAFLWSADLKKYPNVIKNHQEHIRKTGATYWGVGFAVKTDEFDLPFEIPLPLDGYLYEKGGKVKFYAKIEAIESYGKKQLPKEPHLRPKSYATELSRTYLKLSMLESLPRAVDVSEFRKWKDQKPVPRPPQNYTIVLEPAGLSAPTSERVLEAGSLEKLKFLLEKKKQIILYGPPGTGKTYQARAFSARFLGEKYGELHDNGQIEFMTFHPSYSYEEFVEGITVNTEPESNEAGSGEICYIHKWGIFKKICTLALARAINENLLNKESWKDQWSYIYGKYKDNTKGKSREKINNEIWKNADKFVLIIDEINRGDISKTLGELVTLLEDDKRFAQENEIIVQLPYSNDYFAVPPNIYIIGTMNTADRSIALVDIALRRRFGFVEMAPDFDVLASEHIERNKEELQTNNVYEYLIKSVKAMKKINGNIVDELGRDKQIGHSFFFKVFNQEDLIMVWQYEILPLLEEYYYCDYDKILRTLDVKSDNPYVNKVRGIGGFKKVEELDEFLKDILGETGT